MNDCYTNYSNSDSMLKIELPFDYAPPAAMYHGCAFPFGIVSANAKTDITPWLCGKFINCMFDLSMTNKFSHYFEDSWFRNDGMLIIRRINLIPETYKAIFGQDDIITLMKKAILAGFYPGGNYNEEKIPGKSAFQRWKMKHDFLLTGFDDSLQCFISAGYLGDRHYHKFEIPYANMKAAFEDYTNEFITCNFWEFNQNADFSLRLSEVSCRLDEYCKSETHSEVCKNKRTFGLEAMNSLANHILDECLNNQYLDPRYTLGILEHKTLMLKRINYLTSVGLLENEDYQAYATANYDKAVIIQSLGVKYTITKDARTAHRIYDLINEINSDEKEYLPMVVNQLKSKGGDCI